MRSKGLIQLGIVLFLLFVFLGDKVLPKPLSTTSLQIRNTLDSYLMGIFPQKRFKNPNERTENAVDELEKRRQR